MASQQSTASITYVDLATVGPTATVAIGATGKALIILTCNLTNDGANIRSLMSFAASGANTIAADDARAIWNNQASGGGAEQQSAVYLRTGLTAGSTTFTAKYRTSSGAQTATFVNREIAVITL